MTVLKLHIAHEGTEIPLAWTEPCWKDLGKRANGFEIDDISKIEQCTSLELCNTNGKQ